MTVENPRTALGVMAFESGRESSLVSANNSTLQFYAAFTLGSRSLIAVRHCTRAHLNYRDSMGQQHRVRAKRKRRQAYLRRKKAATKVARREPAGSKAKKQQAPPAIKE
jgi:hypothetical protein